LKRLSDRSGRRCCLTMDEDWINSFREKLDEHYAWPALYIYKFIVPIGKEDLVKQLFPLTLATEKLSKQGNYISVTIQKMMYSSDAVIEVYIKAAEIDGIIAL
jgi:uncharacterized protein